ncbi:MAG: hypothetical protein ABFR82_05670 [Nitrospirota bacterium]
MIFKKVSIFILTILFCTASLIYADNTPRVAAVVETFNAGNYTYLKLDEDGKEVWLASQPMKVSAGEKVEYIGGVPMKNFYSRSLERTFEDILLITRIKVLGTDPEKDKLKEKNADDHKAATEKSKTAEAPQKGEVKKAENGKTVQEIFSEREQLKDKEVVLRAKVIKVSTKILGMNWITLSDGTGEAPENKITATTSEDINAGDILTVKGVIKNDVSIGSGYNYKVLIGDARFTK